MYKPKTSFVFAALLIISVCFWALSVTTTRYDFSTSVFSYFQSLPWSYWVSLSILIFLLALRLGENKNTIKWRFLDLLLVFAFVLVLFGTPSFIENMPRMFDVYGHAGTALIVQSSGNAASSLLNDPNVNPLSYSVTYPGFFVFLTTFWSVTGLSWITTAQYYPIFLMMLLSFFIYLIARKFSSQFAVLAPILFLSFSWFQEFHESPQSFALILYLLVWLILSELLLSNTFRNRRYHLIPLIIVLVCIIISHQGTPIFIILNLFAFLILFLCQKKIRISIINRQIIKVLIIICFSIFIIWGLYSATLSLLPILSSIPDSISSFLSRGPTSKLISTFSPEYLQVNYIREVETGLFNIIVFISGLILFIRVKAQRKNTIILFIWFISCWIFVLYSFSNSGLYMERPAMFSLFPASILMSVFVLSFKKKHIKFLAIFCALLVAGGCIILPITRNANDAFETPTDSYVSSAKFAVSHTYDQIGVYIHTGVIGIYSIIANNTSLKMNHFTDVTYLFPKSTVFLFDQLGYSRAVNTGNITFYKQFRNFCEADFSRVFDSYDSQMYINKYDNLNITQALMGEKP